MLRLDRNPFLRDSYALRRPEGDRRRRVVCRTSIHSSTAAPMLSKRILVLSAFLFLLPLHPAFASDGAPAYVDLKDAPTITVDWSKGNTQAVTLHGDRVIQFTHGQKGGKYLLILKQDATGSRTVKWQENVQWPGYDAHPQPPILTTTANKKDFLGFFYDGERYDALSISQGF